MGSKGRPVGDSPNGATEGENPPSWAAYAMQALCLAALVIVGLAHAYLGIDQPRVLLLIIGGIGIGVGPKEIVDLAGKFRPHQGEKP